MVGEGRGKKKRSFSEVLEYLCGHRAGGRGEIDRDREEEGEREGKEREREVDVG